MFGRHSKMAECAILQSNFNLHFQRRYDKGCWTKPQNLSPRKFSRKHQFGSVAVWKPKYNTLSLSSRHRTSTVLRGSSMKCKCSGIMIDLENAAGSGWVPVIDQVLLTASVLLTYMAGVIPSKKSYISSEKNNSSDVLLLENPVFFEEEGQSNCECNWTVVKGKITDSLLAYENGVIAGDNFDELELNHSKRPFSLSALAHGSRLRLLLSSVEQLEKEVNKIPDISATMERGEWLELLSTTLTKACRAAFISWMDKELSTKPDKELLYYMSEKLKEDEMILGNIRKSGKMELYADLIGFFRYSFFRDCSYYDQSVYTLHGSAILEDLVIRIADAMASTYLEVISVDSEVSTKISNLGMSLCALSTRALQKLRNEVAMFEWMHRNFGEIVLMYEDQFELRVLSSKPCLGSAEKQKENLSWWSKLTLKTSAKVESSLRYAVVSPFSLSVKRTKELRALKGWRYYFSLVLELADIAMPMSKAVVAQVRNAISFFLVSLIGRSVGLVYTGIRQSLRWK
ncbi:hypothetical protein RND81_05G218400 [Saponaria officinalis]|uniref:Uncharacterized protein n=1 Tax=Saponaria officinalis TaxID=3572 RepID=A0AAW1L2Y3_SAPOF